MAQSKDNSKSDHDEILRVARERYRLAEDGWAQVYKDAEDDTNFLFGEQWDDQDRSNRKIEGRPCLVINKLPQYANQVVNDIKQNRPAIKLSPVDSFADIETAKIRQGLIRHIESRSGASAAYDRSVEGAVYGGFGFFRVRHDYVSPTSFNQELIVDRIHDCFSVKIDPFSKELDGSDMNWGFIETTVSKDDYCAEHPESEKAKKGAEWTGFGSEYTGWISEKSIRICEYFCKEFVDAEIVLLSDGRVFESDKVPQILEPDVGIVDSRKIKKPIIKHYKITGFEVLEEGIFPGKYIPIIPVYGKVYYHNGKRRIEGIVRNSKDPQRMYNYWATCETETIALAPKAPFLIAEGQIPKEYEHQWKTANTKSYAYLPYKPISIGGQVVGEPRRNVFEPPVQAITNARMQSSEDLKSTTGIYDAAMGARSNENSGVAIQRRANQAQTSNFHFADNLHASIRHAGRILNEAIPYVYDTARAERIIGDEGNEEVVQINQEIEKQGEKITYDLTVGEYDVTVDVGPSYATKRQEAAASMLDLAASNPNLMQIAGDLIIKSLDLPGAQELAERVKKTLPPGLAEDNKDQKPLPPEVQAQMQQMNQLIDQLTEKLNQANEETRTKKIELESKERIEMAKIQAEIEITMAKLGSQEAVELLRQEVSQLENRMALLKYNEPIEDPSQPDFNEVPPDQQQFDQQQQLTGELPPGPIVEGNNHV